MNAVQKKETGSHYTSFDLSNFMAEKLLQYYTEINGYTKNELSVLDPSCGDGELLKAVDSAFDKYSLQLIGIDTNNEAINKLKSFENNNKLIALNQDYLDLIDSQQEVNLFSQLEADMEGPLFEEGTLKHVDLIIANPPYVRTQVMGADKSQELGAKFNLKGKVDLYQVFLVAMIRQLKENGLICVITSNRYLTTAGGKDTRKFLDNNYEVLEVIDLGDTKLFDAAVLPAIFIGRKKGQNELIQNKSVKFSKIYEASSIENEIEIKNIDSIFNALKQDESGLYNINDKNYEVTSGYLSIPEDPKDLWVMASKEEKAWADLLKKNAKFKFDDVFKVRVGIKTTADPVFISDNWERLDDNVKPESELIFPLVSSEYTAKWKIDSNLIKNKILYTHYNNNGKKEVIDITNYPRANNYLNMHREQLEGRKYVINAKRNWYEIWVPQDPLALSKPKVIFPDISVSPKFSIDLNGYMVDGNCYWLTLKDDNNLDLLYLATAVANSKLMNRYHEIEFQNVLYSGRKRYLTQYVKHYLLPDPLNKYSIEVIKLTKKICSETLSAEKYNEIENLIEENILKAFNINLLK